MNNNSDTTKYNNAIKRMNDFPFFIDRYGQSQFNLAVQNRDFGLASLYLYNKIGKEMYIKIFEIDTIINEIKFIDILYNKIIKDKDFSKLLFGNNIEAKNSFLCITQHLRR